MQQPMHNMLARQLKRHLGRADALPSEWLPLIEAVNDAYHEFDKDRGMIERSLDLSSEELIQGNADLHESEERYRTVLDSTTDMASVKDEAFRYVLTNKATQEFFGLSAAAIAGKTDYDLMPKPMADNCRTTDQKALGQNAVVITQEEVGGKIYDTRKFSLRLKNGKMGLGAFIRDITESKRTEHEIRELLVQGDKARMALLGILEDAKRAGNALLESTAFLDSIIENIPNMIFIKDAGELRFVRFNKAGEALLGQSRDDLIGKNDYDFFPREQADFFVEKDRKVLASGSVLDIPEESLKTKDRGIRILHTKKLPILDPDGKPLYLLGISEDITDRKQAEEELRRNYDIQKVIESLLRLSLDDVPLETSLRSALELVLAIPWLSIESKGAIFVTGDKPDILRMIAQRGLCDAVRASCAEVPFGHCLCGMAASTRTLQFCDRINEDHVVRYQGMAPHGHYCVPILSGARVLGVMVLYLREGHERNEREMDFLRSVGDAIAGVVQLKSAEQEVRKLNEELERKVRDRTAQLEEANKELESFSYSVSHDLRAPLRSIDGFSQHVLEEYKDSLAGEGVEDLGRVRAAAQKMSRLIDDMLSLSRLTRQDMKIGPVDLSRVAEQIVSELRQAEPAREVDVVVAQGAMASGDGHLLHQVLQNLLSNAWKFTRNCEKPRIEFGVEEQDGKRVFFVRDNGAGFDMAYAKKLFGVFQRLHSEAEFEGTGVGLAIVQRIIHRHGGKVWAESEVGKGTTFYFTM